MRVLLSLAVVSTLVACGGETIVSSDTDAAQAPRAIRYGSLDGDAHPQVGLMVAQDVNGTPLWRCSGAMISPTVFLTAGHCTSGAAHVEIWFDADLRVAPSYPFVGDVSGAPYTHPDYESANFAAADVGVVVLSSPVLLSEYGSLPDEDALDALVSKRGLQQTKFTAVGYGLQFSNPVFDEAERIRMSATPSLVQMNSALTGQFSLLLSNNANSGGTCFGDSGGPNFIGSSTVVGGVTSYGINRNCAGTGGVFRMDRAAARNWVKKFLD